MQILGGISYTDVYPVERLLRDVRLITIWTGSNEIMDLVISPSSRWSSWQRNRAAGMWRRMRRGRSCRMRRFTTWRGRTLMDKLFKIRTIKHVIARKRSTATEAISR